jgi:PAS domain S-box-containing protein
VSADWRAAFDEAPVGMALSRERRMVAVNRELLAIFAAVPDQLLEQSFAVLYPSAAEFEHTGERIVQALDAQGRYADQRVMRRLGGAQAGELFWCQVSGRALDRSAPHAAGIWVFEDLSAERTLSLDLTPREREIAALLIAGRTSKLIGKALGISPRTVEVYRARLMRKTGAASAAELVRKLLERKTAP